MIAFTAITFLLLFLPVGPRSLDPMAYAFAFPDLALVYLTMYGILLGFLATPIWFSPRQREPWVRWASWSMALLLVAAIIQTSSLYVRLRALTNQKVFDTWAITSVTGEIGFLPMIVLYAFLAYLTATIFVAKPRDDPAQTPSKVETRD